MGTNCALPESVLDCTTFTEPRMGSLPNNAGLGIGSWREPLEVRARRASPSDLAWSTASSSVILEVACRNLSTRLLMDGTRLSIYIVMTSATCNTLPQREIVSLSRRAYTCFLRSISVELYSSPEWPGYYTPTARHFSTDTGRLRATMRHLLRSGISSLQETLIS